MIHDRPLRGVLRSLALVALAASASLLAACAGEEAAPPPCPALVVVKDADRLTRFQGAGRDLTDVLFETEIRNAAIGCKYDDGNVEAGLRVIFATTRGPADETREAKFDYFVAVADRDKNILAREEFDLASEFPGNRNEVLQIDEIEPTIPLAEGKTGSDYIVYVGLILSRDEVEYNRRNAR